MRSENKLRVGVTLPLLDTGGAPETVRVFAETAERLGYHHLAAPDHVLGVNLASRPDWSPDRNTSADFFHDPFVLFGFAAACTERIEFSTQVLILPQRQTALVAKQAASLDVLSGGRFRFGVGIGWNPVEYAGLNENFHDRGQRSVEQIELLRALWASPHVDFKGRWHRIDDAGINPLPGNRKIPLWLGGHHDATLRRIAEWADGWMMLAYPAGDEAIREFEKLRGYARARGRDPAEIGIEVWVTMGQGGPEDWARELGFWRDAGVTHVTLNNTFGRYHQTRMAGGTLADHLAAIERYREVIEEFI